MEPQVYNFLIIKLEHKILRKPFNVSLYLFIQGFRLHSVQLRKVTVQNNTSLLFLWCHLGTLFLHTLKVFSYCCLCRHQTAILVLCLLQSGGYSHLPSGWSLRCVQATPPIVYGLHSPLFLPLWLLLHWL